METSSILPWHIQQYHEPDYGYHGGFWKTIDLPYATEREARDAARRMNERGYSARVIHLHVVQDFPR